MEIVAKIIFINILQAKNSEIQLQDTKASPSTAKARGLENLPSFFMFRQSSSNLIMQKPTITVV
jgi:hypothetical protein